MLEALRKWGKRSSTPAHHASTHAQLTDRKLRADTVERLRADISRLQHEISDLNDEMTASLATSAQESRMANLHQSLTASQRELGKYQARI